MYKFNFDKKLNDFLSIVVKCASECNFNVYIVGGAVRDYFLNVPVKDIDLIVEGNALEFSKLLPECIKIKSIHKDFATVKVEYEDITFDIASTRIEKYPYSGCLPQVIKVGVDIKKDVTRRDFTVNSLYFKLSLADNTLNYELIDFYSGVGDISKKELKVLHNKSYIDDPTRILRGVGLKYRFGFDFSNNDKKLISDYLDNINRDNMSVDRCETVFYDTLLISPLKVFNELVANNYYRIISPEEINFDFNRIKKCIDMFNLENSEQADFLMKIIADKPVDAEGFKTNLEIFQGFKKYKTIEELAYYYYKTQDCSVIKYLSFKDVKIHLNGDDLINLGYTQGKLFSEIFNRLYAYKLDNTDKIMNKNDEIKFVKTVFPIN